MRMWSHKACFPGKKLNPPSCYSAYEHSILTNGPSSAGRLAIASQQTNAPTNLPLDISLETVASVVLICLGLVSGAEDLKPINWRVWASQVEEESGGGGPYQGLDERIGFVNIRVSLRLWDAWMTEDANMHIQAKRKEFADWVRRQDKEESHEQ